MFSDQPHMLDPSTNNMPLQFNSNKGKPPGYVINDRNPDGLMNPMAGGSNGPGGGGGGEGMMQGPNQMMQGPGFIPGPMSGMGFSGPMMGPDPNMMMMIQQYGNWGPMGPVGPGNMGMGPMMPGGPPQKEIIRLKPCVLYPPSQNSMPEATRERPAGCRTIFIGGLPENVTEEVLKEVFSNFGPICSVRKNSKKNFCHIRYESEDCVERSLFLSGYRMKLEDKDDKPNTGKIHVDYATARDDQYEFECRQRAFAREWRHQQMLEEERLRPPSPPPVIHYNDHEVNTLIEKLKSDEDFMNGSQILITWFDRGNCDRRTVNQFYTLVQCTNSHVRRLLQEKQHYELELEQMKEKFKQNFEGIIRQFDQIEKVFEAAHKQRSWDHFSKAQRKNLDLWYKQAQEIKKIQQEEFLNSRQEDEMEMSDTEDDGAGKKRKLDNQTSDAADYITYENAQLKCQVEAFKNEIDSVREENQSALNEKDKQLKCLQQALQGMQQQLIQSRNESREIEKKLEAAQVQYQAKTQALSVIQAQMQKSDSVATSGEETGATPADKDSSGPQEKSVSEDKEPSDKTKDSETNEALTETQEDTLPGLGDLDILATVSHAQSVSTLLTAVPGNNGGNGLSITEKEVKLVGLTSCFLHVHPNGASIDYIWSYLHQLGHLVKLRELEDLLEKLPMLFKEDIKGVGATIERSWKFVGYNSTAV